MAQDYSKIRLPPKWDRIKFVDGYSAGVIMKRPEMENGKNIWLMDLEPSDELKKRYELKFEQQSFRMAFPQECIVTLSDDPGWREYFCILTWDGKTTHVTDWFNGKPQIEELSRTKEDLNRAKLEIADLKDKIDTANTNMKKYIKDNMGTMAELIGPALKNAFSQPSNSGGGS